MTFLEFRNEMLVLPSTTSNSDFGILPLRSKLTDALYKWCVGYDVAKVMQKWYLQS